MRPIDADKLIAKLEDDAEHMEEPIAQMFTYAAINDIKHAPTITPEPHWIPCSERMPETNDEVLTTYIVNGNDKKRYVEAATWWGDDSDEGGYWTSINDEYRVLGTMVERIAWMSFPKPWKGGEQNG